MNRCYDLFARCSDESIKWQTARGRSILAQLQVGEREDFASEINTMLVHCQAAFPHRGLSLMHVLSGRVSGVKKWDVMHFRHLYGVNLRIVSSPSTHCAHLQGN